MPEELRGILEVAAKQSKRSLNAEIIARLEESFDPLGQIPLQAETKHALENAASMAGNFLNAEIAFRLAATRELDLVMAKLTDGDLDYSSSAQWLLDLWQQVGVLEKELDEAQNNPTILDGAQIVDDVAKKIRAPELETVVAVMALTAAFPDSLTDDHRKMLLSAASQIAGAESSSPETAITIALKQLLANITLRERGIS
tara:strand:- start:882 stop:1481 length:600 start_codon:yes stop_codon:yes gene_type:complete